MIDLRNQKTSCCRKWMGRYLRERGCTFRWGLILGNIFVLPGDGGGTGCPPAGSVRASTTIIYI